MQDTSLKVLQFATLCIVLGALNSNRPRAIPG
jgi:hypothetical protein